MELYQALFATAVTAMIFMGQCLMYRAQRSERVFMYGVPGLPFWFVLMADTNVFTTTFFSSIPASIMFGAFMALTLVATGIGYIYVFSVIPPDVSSERMRRNFQHLRDMQQRVDDLQRRVSDINSSRPRQPRRDSVGRLVENERTPANSRRKEDREKIWKELKDDPRDEWEDMR